MVRGAFVIGVQHGRGVLLTRGPGGAWQPPRMIQITGGSVGYQIGVQSTDLILIFRTPQSVANVLRGTLKVGVDASAAAGPVGRQASAATDLPLQAEILSYSRARGAFLGVSIDGSSISMDPASRRDVSTSRRARSRPRRRNWCSCSRRSPAAVRPTVAPPTQQVVAVVPNGPPAAPPSRPPSQPAVVPAVPQPTSELETARQQLDASSRQLAASLDDKWKQFLALPAEIYIPNHTPSMESIEQAISRYEKVSEDPQFAALTEPAGVSSDAQRPVAAGRTAARHAAENAPAAAADWGEVAVNVTNLSGTSRRGILDKRTDGDRDDGQCDSRCEVPLISTRCTRSIVKEGRPHDGAACRVSRSRLSASAAAGRICRRSIFGSEAFGRAIHDPLVRAWWDDVGFAGQCPGCGGWIHFTIRGKQAIDETAAQSLPKLPANWADEAVIL